MDKYRAFKANGSGGFSTTCSIINGNTTTFMPNISYLPEGSYDCGVTVIAMTAEFVTAARLELAKTHNTPSF